MSDAFFAIDKDWKVTRVNALHEKVTGIKREDQIGKDLRELFFSDPIYKESLYMKSYTKAMRDRVVVTFEDYYEPLNLWTEVRVYPKPDGGLAIFFTDTGEQKLNEQRLEMERKKLDALISESPSAIGLMRGPELVFELVNKKWTELVGPREYVGRPYAEVYPELVGTAGQKSLIDIFQTGQPFLASEMKLKVMSAAGVFEDQYYDYTNVRVNDADGKPFGIYCNALNVTARVKTQLLINESEDRLKFALASAGMGTWTLDLQTNKTILSDDFRKLFGIADTDLNAASVIDKTIHADDKTIHADDKSRVEKKISDAIRLNIPYRDEYRIVHADGAVRWILAQGRAGYSHDGSPVNLAGVVMDITQRKKLERELEVTADRLDFALVSGNIGIWDLNPQTGQVYVSDTLMRDWGIEPSTYTNTLDEVFKLIHPEDQERIQKELNEATFNGKAYDVEYRVVRPSGEVIWVGAKGKNIVDAAGNPERLAGTTQNITERKNLAEQLQQAKDEAERASDKLQFALESAEMGSWTIDLTTKRIVTSNQARKMFGVDEFDENVYDLINSRMHPEDRAEVESVLNEAVMQNRPYSHEYRIVLPKDNEVRWVHSRGWARYDSEGNSIELTGIVSDTTDSRRDAAELVKAKDEAERANLLKSAFLANMSHEIRTPLGAMIGFADLIRDQGLTDGERANYANIMLRNGEQLSALIDDILDLSKVEAGHLTLEYTDTYHQQIGSDVVSLMQVKAREKDLALDYKADPNTPALITSDPTRVRQILLNLVSNAIKFTKFGAVKIRSYGCKTESGAPALCFEVSDTGMGITEVQQQKLFLTFSQADETTTRIFGGTGLGLALSRRLARALGGDISVVHSKPGVGSVFLVKIADEVAKRSATEDRFKVEDRHETEIPENALKGKKILVVDDAPDNQQLIWRYLTKQGAEVESAENGLIGYRAALAGEFDLVLMDIQMPVMDGYTATLKLREAGYTKPVLALTAHAMNEIRKKALNVGYTDHLTKPIDPKALISAIMKYTNLAERRP